MDAPSSENEVKRKDSNSSVIKEATPKKQVTAIQERVNQITAFKGGDIFDSIGEFFSSLTGNKDLSKREIAKKDMLKEIGSVYQEMNKIRRKRFGGSEKYEQTLKTLSREIRRLRDDRVEQKMIEEELESNPLLKHCKEIMDPILALRGSKFNSFHLIMLKAAVGNSTLETIKPEELNGIIRNIVKPGKPKQPSKDDIFFQTKITNSNIQSVKSAAKKNFSKERTWIQRRDSDVQFFFSWTGYRTERNKVRAEQFHKIGNIYEDIFRTHGTKVKIKDRYANPPELKPLTNDIETLETARKKIKDRTVVNEVTVTLEKVEEDPRLSKVAGLMKKDRNLGADLLSLEECMRIKVLLDAANIYIKIDKNFLHNLENYCKSVVDNPSFKIDSWSNLAKALEIIIENEGLPKELK